MKICVMKIFLLFVLFLFSFSFSAQGITGLRYHFPVIDLADGQDKALFHVQHDHVASESAVLERHVIFLSLSKTFGAGPVRSVFDCIEAEECYSKVIDK